MQPEVDRSLLGGGNQLWMQEAKLKHTFKVPGEGLLSRCSLFEVSGCHTINQTIISTKENSQPSSLKKESWRQNAAHGMWAAFCRRLHLCSLPLFNRFWRPASLKFRKSCHLPANISLRNWQEAHSGQVNYPWRTSGNLQDSAKNLAAEFFPATVNGEKNFISYHCMACAVFKNTNLIMISCKILGLYNLNLTLKDSSRFLNTSFLMFRLIPGEIH